MRSPCFSKASLAASIRFNNSFSPGLPVEPGFVPFLPLSGSPDFPFSLPPGFFDGLDNPFSPSFPFPADAGFPEDPGFPFLQFFFA